MATRIGGVARWLGMAAFLASHAAAADGPAAARGHPARAPRRPGRSCSPNGWSLKPAGVADRARGFPCRHRPQPGRARAGDPSRRVRHARGRHRRGRRRQDHRPGGFLKETRSSRAFARSKDGRRLYVGGGFDDVIRRFDHAKGLLLERVGVRLSPPDLAGPRPGREAWRWGRTGRSGSPTPSGHTFARFDADGKFAKEWPVEKDSYPYGLALDGPRGRLYVSLWNRAEVLAVDAEGRGGRSVADAGAPERDAPDAQRQAALYRQRQPEHGHGRRPGGEQADRDDRHGHRPGRPGRLDAEFARADGRRVDALRGELGDE